MSKLSLQDKHKYLTVSVLPLMPKETFMKCLALVFLVILIRVQNLFLKGDFLKMSAVELFLKLLFHVMVQHAKIQETTSNYKAY